MLIDHIQAVALVIPGTGTNCIPPPFFLLGLVHLPYPIVDPVPKAKTNLYQGPVGLPQQL